MPNSISLVSKNISTLMHRMNCVLDTYRGIAFMFLYFKVRGEKPTPAIRAKSMNF
ncbi:unnamed protein product [Nyctereutes procyonoides]|uniref:(raccoon dog) hypothetical protein n=1 Tax=Nyctereutes procyonoides TaxID=34880 RepID=A0A811Z0N8_NYCPR|nr:unnamed protein product [Nyctereutes procyonoides]